MLAFPIIIQKKQGRKKECLGEKKGQENPQKNAEAFWNFHLQSFVGFLKLFAGGKQKSQREDRLKNKALHWKAFKQ